jgi:hypothetical protein
MDAAYELAEEESLQNANVRGINVDKRTKKVWKVNKEGSKTNVTEQLSVGL